MNRITELKVIASTQTQVSRELTEEDQQAASERPTSTQLQSKQRKKERLYEKNEIASVKPIYFEVVTFYKRDANGNNIEREENEDQNDKEEFKETPLKIMWKKGGKILKARKINTKFDPYKSQHVD